jgi:N-succinyldiaminopimelate aminotransferase
MPGFHRPTRPPAPMNPDLSRLRPYPFQRLARLLEGVQPPAGLGPIPLSIGEPRHPAPGFVAEALIAHLHGLSNYPSTRGVPALREAIAGWLARRYGLRPESLDPERHVLPVNGTREALFAFAQAVVDRTRHANVMMPNPFYQIYEGAALLAGARPVYLNTLQENGYRPDFEAVPDPVWRDTQLVYLCSPGNPTGAVLDRDTLAALIERADRFDFVIAADECYAAIYPDDGAPPVGLLETCAALGRDDYARCVVFHSLSKRSNLPGLRSGFVAGDAKVLERFFLYRTYHGSAMPPATQAASIAAWSDEAHVVENRAVYRRKFDAVLAELDGCLDLERPAGAFYLWPRTPVDGETFARELYARYHVTVLPGSFLSREADGVDPGAGRVRMALVAAEEDCVEAARRIRAFVREAA